MLRQEQLVRRMRRSSGMRRVEGLGQEHRRCERSLRTQRVGTVPSTASPKSAPTSSTSGGTRHGPPDLPVL